MKKSAGILVYRKGASGVQVLLVHPGGPFWARKDAGAWSIPKGEIDPAEDALAAAQREFAEETGMALAGEFLPLGDLRQAGGKHVTAWALELDLDPAAIRSNTFTLEWPPKSGRIGEFPEIDRAEWFDLDAAREKILASQRPFLDRLQAALEGAD
jgi:predicted NUDIX family NTP pyrophosphohydrolase